MAKKQTRRSISVSRNTYERLKSYCETNGISMSQFVERRVGDFLGSTSGLAAFVASARHSSTSDSTADRAGDSREIEIDVDDETRAVAAQIFTF